MKGDLSGLFFVDNVEHFLDEHLIFLHAQSISELLVGEVHGHIMHHGLAPGSQRTVLLTESQRHGVGLSEEHLQPLLSGLLGLRILKQILSTHFFHLQASLEGCQERLEFREEFFTIVHRLENQDQIVGLVGLDQHHRAGGGVQGEPHLGRGEAGQPDPPLDLRLPVDRVDGEVRSEEELDEPFLKKSINVIRVQDYKVDNVNLRETLKIEKLGFHFEGLLHIQ